MVVLNATGHFWRIQCKTAWVEEGDQGYIKFSTASLRSRQNGGRIHYSRKDYQGDIDYFAVYSHEMRKVYLIPIEKVSETRMSLRLAPSKNNQKKRVHFAEDYEL